MPAQPIVHGLRELSEPPNSSQRLLRATLGTSPALAMARCHQSHNWTKTSASFGSPICCGSTPAIRNTGRGLSARCASSRRQERRTTVDFWSPVSCSPTGKLHRRHYISRLLAERMTQRRKGYLPPPFESRQFTNGLSG